MTDEEKKIRMKKCDHVFALIHGGRRHGAYHQRRFCTNPVIECVKCGITNKNINTDRMMSNLMGYSVTSIESECYEEFMEKKKKENLQLKFLSRNNIGTDKPFIVYHLARQVNLSLDITSPECYPLIEKTMHEIIKIVHEFDFDLYYSKDLLEIIRIYNERREPYPIIIK